MMTSLPLLASLAGLVLALSACKPDQKAPEPEKEKTSSAPAPEEAEAAKPDDPSDAASYVGMTLEAAKARADKAGIPNRVVEEDGESNPVTMDHRPERLNFAVKAGKVIRVTKG